MYTAQISATLAFGASVALAAGNFAYSHNPNWNLSSFTSLVAFGDSYTDDSRLGYFISHNGSAPPVGYANPVNYNAADGGRTWVEYVKQYTGANLYNYAVSGAVCSNDITPRFFSAINADFPAIQQYEIPAYIADRAYTTANGTKFVNAPADSTVYSIWIGTNDLGIDAFITDSQVPGTTLVTYMDCVFAQVQSLYNLGARFFVLQNVAPLQLAPLYGLPGQGGVGDNQYWPNKSQDNLTAISDRMLEQVVTVNAIYEYRTPYMVKIMNSFPGASFAVMDMYSLFTDIHDYPSRYLNGSLPYNVTGYINHCSVNGTNCVRQSNPDSYMWFDELHPSEQTERIVARTFLDVINGISPFATYWSS
ncbi:hypothetical protein MBLNU457_6445t1 [Dothideomycetes sp. NU457]